MPERNLVPRMTMNHWLMLTMMVALLIVETGCSKIGRRGFTEQLTNSSSTPDGSTSRYGDNESNRATAPPPAHFDSQTAEKSGSDHKQHQYVVDEAQSKHNADATVHFHDHDGHHQHANKRPQLRLSFDDPLELPPTAVTNSVAQAPASTSLRNPLTPLESDQSAPPEQAPLQLSATTPIEVQPPTLPEPPIETEDTTPTPLAAAAPEVPLAPELPDEIKNETPVDPAQKTEPQLAADRFLIEPKPNQKPSQIDEPFEFQPVEKSSRRAPTQIAAETASTSPDAPELKRDLPVVGVIEETPNISVAQNPQQSPAPASDFAPTENNLIEFTPEPAANLASSVDDSNDFAVSPTPSPTSTQSTLAPIAQNERSFNDLSDAEWDSIFGATETDQALPTPNTTANSGDFQPAVANDFQPISDFQASPIATAAPVETENQFQPASFNEKPANDLSEPKSVELTNSNDPIIDSVITQLNQAIANVNTQIANTTSDQIKSNLAVDLEMLDALQKQISNAKNARPIFHTESLHWLAQLQQIQDLIRQDSLQNAETIEPPKDNQTQQPSPETPKTTQLRIPNCNFCTEVSGFGQFKPFPSAEFSPTQRMLVYCEVENYTSQTTFDHSKTTFVTRLEGSYKIFDNQGTIVQQAKYAALEDVSYNQRSDFYMHFPMQLGELPAGEYRFELTITDLNNNSTATHQQGISFSVTK